MHTREESANGRAARPAHSVSNSGLDHLRATTFLIADWVKRCASAKFWAACNVGAARLISVATRDAAATACMTGFAAGIRKALIIEDGRLLPGGGIFKSVKSSQVSTPFHHCWPTYLSISRLL